MQKQSLRFLPANKSPTGTRCIQITIPDDDDWERDLYSEMYRLGIWALWERDEGKNGAKVARIWRQAFKTWQHCEPPTLPALGVDSEDFMIRQNPDNPCLLESSVDGQTWCVWADLSKCMNFGSQPGSGNSPQPPKPGGSQEYCYKLNANSALLIPVAINAGDTIQITSQSGAGWDGGELSLVPFPIWRCPDGQQFFAGQCVGNQVTDSGDPLPTSKHMAIIARIGSNFYDLQSGPLTVPSGIANQQFSIQVNDSALDNNQGSYDVCIKVTNNAAATWCHDLDFALNPYGFAPFPLDDSPGGSYVPGTGFVGVTGTINPSNDYCDIKATFAACHIASIRLVYSIPSNSGGGWDLELTTGSGTDTFALPSTVGPNDVTHAFNDDNVTAIVVLLESHLPSGHATITRMVVQGSGPDPFSTAPVC